jgi:hypothetical protein
MKRQFQREYHNKQDKVRQVPTHYPGTGRRTGQASRLWEEEFRIDWSKDPPQIKVIRVFNEQLQKRTEKASMGEWFLGQLQGMRFLIEGFKFRFKYSVQQFAQANRMPLDQAQVVFPKISKLAHGKLQIVVQRFQRTPLRYKMEPTPDGEGFEMVAKVDIEWTDVLTPEHPPT